MTEEKQRLIAEMYGVKEVEVKFSDNNYSRVKIKNGVFRAIQRYEKRVIKTDSNSPVLGREVDINLGTIIEIKGEQEDLDVDLIEIEENTEKDAIKKIAKALKKIFDYKYMIPDDSIRKTMHWNGVAEFILQELKRR